MSLRPIALLAVLLLAGLFARDAWPPDETRYADVARGMSAGEGWLIPQLQHRVYHEKPPVAFWLAAGLVKLGLPAGAAPRAASGLAALATLALLPIIATALSLSQTTASRAGWVLATSPLFLAYAQSGLLDAGATAWVTAAIAAKLARANADNRGRAWLSVCEGLALTAALLTKGPVLLLFPLGLRLGAAFARERSAASADTSDATALAVTLLTVGTWAFAAADAAGAPYVFGLSIGQVAQRITGDAPHLRPPGYLLAITLAGLLPWILLGTPLVRLRAAWRRRAGGRLGGARAALLGWIVLPLLLLSLLRTQQPHYLLPALPAFALLLGQSLGAPERWAARGAAGLAVLASAVLAIRAFAAPVFSEHPVELALAGDLPLRATCALAAVLLLGLVMPPTSARFAVWKRAVVAVSVIAMTAIIGFARLDPWLSPRELLANVAVRHARELAAPRNACSSVRIHSGRSDVVAKGAQSVARWLSAEPDRVALVWQRDLGRLAFGSMHVETIGRGHLGGRPLIALRVAQTTRPQPDRIP